MPPQQEQAKKPRLDNATIALMVGLAIFYDALQALLNLIFMGWLVTILAFLSFWLWFKIKGISFMTAKRMSIIGGGALIEAIPMLDTLPGWTGMVTLIVLDAKLKDKAGI